MRGFATHPIEFMPKLLLILRFYRSAMLFFCGAVSVALAWLVTGYGPSVVPLCLAGKMVIYPVYLYVWIIPRYNDEFDYYRNLGGSTTYAVGCELRHRLAGVLYAADIRIPCTV